MMRELIELLSNQSKDMTIVVNREDLASLLTVIEARDLANHEDMFAMINECDYFYVSSLVEHLNESELYVEGIYNEDNSFVYDETHILVIYRNIPKEIRSQLISKNDYNDLVIF